MFYTLYRSDYDRDIRSNLVTYKKVLCKNAS